MPKTQTGRFQRHESRYPVFMGVSMSYEAAEYIEAQAEERQCSKSAVVREMIEIARKSDLVEKSVKND